MTIGILPNVSSEGPKRDVDSAQSAHFRTGRLRNSPTKGRRRVVTKVHAAAFVKKCATVRLRRICNDFSEGHTFRDQFDEHGSQELRCVRQTSEKVRSTAWENNARNLRTDLQKRQQDKSDVPVDAWELARKIFSLKKARHSYILFTFRGVDLAGRIHKKTEEREFVVDSRACVHMVSKKDLNKAELETVKVSENPTTVVTANSEVLPKRRGNSVCQGIGFTRDGDASRRYTGSSLTLKLCEDHGYSYEWTSGQKPQLIKEGRRMTCSTENYVPIVVPGLSTSSSTSSSLTSPTSSSQESVTPRSIEHQQEVRI